MYSDVFGIVGDASYYHIYCARKIYGNATIERVLTGVGAPSAGDYGASAAEGWPKDSEGNALRCLLTGQDDACDGEACSQCFHPIEASGESSTAG
jgi:hypothetical protein